MSETNNLSTFFASLGKAEEASKNNNSGTAKAEKPVEGSLLDLCYAATRGNSLLKPINDINDKPLRTINNVVDVFEKFPIIRGDGTMIIGEDGKPWTSGRHTYVMAPNNYVCQLTPEQIKLQTDLLAALDKYNKLVNEDEVLDPENTTTKMYATKRWKITLFWAKVLSLTVPGQGCIISDGIVRLCRHHGSSFREDLLNATAQKTALKQGNDTWLGAFFNRVAGPSTAVMSCSIVQAQGFKNTISFEEQGPNFEVTDADIALATDLNAAGDSPSKPEIFGLNATVYPEEQMRDLYNRVMENISKFSNNVGAAVASAQIAQAGYVAPQQVQAQAQPIQAAPVQPVQPTVAPIPPQSNLTGFFNNMQQAAPQVVQTPVQPVVNAQTTPVQPVVQPVQPVHVAPVVNPAPQVPTL